MTAAVDGQARQLCFDELGAPLHAITFVVVDLETTGGAAASDGIAEVGAVKVRGGEVLGEFQTLVNPQRSISPFVSVLTGITDGELVRGVRYGPDSVETESIVTRSKSGTIRTVRAEHRLSKLHAYTEAADRSAAADR